MTSWEELRSLLDEANFVYTDLFALVGAAYVSRSWTGEPLWILVVGPPSTGKTFTMSQYEECQDIWIVSALTPAALISGFGGDKVDRSLMADLNDVLLIAKDFGTILSMGYERSQEVFSILREAFDGHVKKDFGMIRREYRPHFNFIAASTFACERFSAFRGQLGERFIRYSHSGLVIPNPPPKVDDALKASIASWIDNHSGVEPELSLETRTTLGRLGDTVAKIRTEVIHKGHGDDILEVPGFEGPFRLTKQFTKLYKSLLTLTDDPAYSMKLTKIVASDALAPRREKVLRMLLSSNEPVKTTDLVQKLRLGDSVIRGILKDLHALGIVDRVILQKWQHAFFWSINERFIEPLTELFVLEE